VLVINQFTSRLIKIYLLITTGYWSIKLDREAFLVAKSTPTRKLTAHWPEIALELQWKECGERVCLRRLKHRETETKSWISNQSWSFITGISAHLYRETAPYANQYGKLYIKTQIAIIKETKFNRHRLNLNSNYQLKCIRKRFFDEQLWTSCEPSTIDRWLYEAQECNI